MKRPVVKEQLFAECPCNSCQAHLVICVATENANLMFLLSLCYGFNHTVTTAAALLL
jgi:hypothetical protein